MIRAIISSALCLALVGCDAARSLLSGAEKPSVRLVGANLRDLSLQGLTLAVDVEVGNPYSVPLPITNLDYALSSDGKQVLTGKAASQGSVPAKGSKPLTLPVTVKFLDLLAALQGVRPGAVVPYKAELAFGLDTPVGAMSVPVATEGLMPIPTVPEVSLASVKWEELSLSKASAKAVVDLKNGNQFAMSLARLGYELNLGGVTVGSGGVTGAPSLSAGGTSRIEIPLSFSPRQLGTAAFNMLTGREAGYSIKGMLDVGTPFGNLSMPYEKSGTTSLVR